MRLLAATLLFVACVGVVCNLSTAAQTGVVATKFDAYGDLPTDDEAARLDAFNEALRNQSQMRGFLVGYNQATAAPGIFLRRLYGDRRYLVEMRGLDADRVVVVEGGNRAKFTIELWLVPNGATPPSPAPSLPPPDNSGKRLLFDEECLECSPAVGLDLYGLSDGLRFYANALQRDSRARGLIVVRPGQEIGPRGVLREARGAKRLLVREHRIAGNRIAIRLARRRKDNVSTAQMWIIK